jgi:hypothetical protein
MGEDMQIYLSSSLAESNLLFLSFYFLFLFFYILFIYHSLLFTWVLLHPCICLLRKLNTGKLISWVLCTRSSGFVCPSCSFFFVLGVQFLGKLGNCLFLLLFNCLCESFIQYGIA